MPSTHTHPIQWLDRLTQYGAAAVLVVMLAAAVLQLVLAVMIAPAFALTALFTLALAPFILMLTAATPAVTVAPEGIILQPRVWKTQMIPWQAVTAIKPYPLLPPPDGEMSRRALAGRRNYRPAEGLMLVIPSLPVQYRVAGALAGEGFIRVIAVTTRTHARYDVLVKKLRVFHEEANT